MKDAENKLFQCGVIPVMKINDAQTAVPLCRALLDGGISVAEITFRTEAAERSIQNVSRELKHVYVGAGTVIDVSTAEKAVNAGAKFIVSPGFNEPVIEYCLKHEIPVFPGISSPTEIEKGLAYGLNVLKFFPAEANGGIKALKSMAAPYHNIRFMPTGGIDENNLLDYLEYDKVIACGGSWMVREDLINQGMFEKITEITKKAVLKLHNFSFKHMAINTDSQNQAMDLAHGLNDLFSTGFHETEVGFFAGNQIEIMGNSNIGRNGHIAFQTTNVERAMIYLEKKGMEFDYTTIKSKNGVPVFIYLKKDFAGFKIHLIQN